MGGVVGLLSAVLAALLLRALLAVLEWGL